MSHPELMLDLQGSHENSTSCMRLSICDTTNYRDIKRHRTTPCIAGSHHKIVVDEDKVLLQTLHLHGRSRIPRPSRTTCMLHTCACTGQARWQCRNNCCPCTTDKNRRCRRMAASYRHHRCQSHKGHKSSC